MPNLVSILRKRAKYYPHKIAYIFLDEELNEKKSITYRELDIKARAIAAYLQKQQLQNERVLLLYPQGIEFICAFMGCLYAGAIAIPASPPKILEFKKSKLGLNAIATNSTIAGILTSTDHRLAIENCLQEFLALNKKVFITDTLLIETDNSVLYTPVKIKDNTIAYLQYSSGSTAQPKAAVIQHKQLNVSLKCNEKIWHYSKKSITLNWAPHTHVYGLVCGLLIPLHHGTRGMILPVEAFLQKPSSWLHAITKYQVTHSGCPNFGYELCVQEIKLEELVKINLTSWKVAINGGEKVQPNTLRKFYEKFAASNFNITAFCSAYGSSELVGTIAVTPYLHAPYVLHLGNEALKNNAATIVNDIQPHQTLISSGRFMPGLEAIIVNPKTFLPIKTQKIGELWLAGKSIANGYWNNPEETKKYFNVKLKGSKKSYFRTGDLGFISKNEFFLTGRLKDMLVLHGKKYYPTDLENSVDSVVDATLLGHNHVAFSVTVDNKEEVVFLQEVKNNISTANQIAINTAIPYALSKEHGISLHEIVLVSEDTLPKTASGKLQRTLCKQKYLDNELDKIYQQVNNQAKQKTNTLPMSAADKKITQGFTTLIAQALGIEETIINLESSLSEYHLDSISIVKLTHLLNDTYHINLTPAVIFEYATFSGLLNYLLNNFKEITAYYNSLASLIDSTEDALTKYQKDKVAVNTNSQDIAIIGMSGLFPGSNDLESFWDNLITGKDVITEIPSERWGGKTYFGKEDNSATEIKWGGFIENIGHFDANFFNISPREAELIDPQQRLFMQTVWKTIEDAGYSTEVLAKRRTGLFVGVFNNDYAEILQAKSIKDAYVTTGTTHSILANRISYLFNLSGPSEAIDTACSSSLVALHHAVKAIQDADCEVAIVGGVNALLSPSPFMVATNAGMLSADGRCKTFDVTANGYVRSEGVAAILIKSLEQARVDGDHIYGVIKGTAVNHGGHVSSLTVPNPNAQADVIISACERARIDIRHLNYIETHGTGTALGDPIEVNGLKKAFKILANGKNLGSMPTQYCGLGAVKSNIGHLEAAAGIAGIIKVLLAMQHKKIPGNLHFNQLNSYIELEASPFYVISKTQLWERQKNNAGLDIPYLAGISSFGFGGTNAHVILEEAPTIQATAYIKKPHLITLSAKTETALQNRVRELVIWLQKQFEEPALADLSYTLNVGRNHFAKRCMFVSDSIADLIIELNNFLKTGQTQPIQSNDTSISLIQKNSPAINSLNDYRNKLHLLGKKYLAGEELVWEELYEENPRRISLPTYPFDQEYYWATGDNSPVKNSSDLVVNEMSYQNNNALAKLVRQDLITEISHLLKIKPEKITLSVALSDLGFDSITFKEFGVYIENTFQIQLNPAIFFTYTSLDVLSEYLAENYTQPLQVHFKALLPNQFINPKKPDAILAPVSNEANADGIAVIGMHGYFPQSKDLNEFWEHLAAGDDLVDEIPLNRWNWRDYYGDAKNDSTKTNSKWAACLTEIDKFDAAFFNISAREAKLMDPQQRLLLEVVWKTIEDAGYDPHSFSGKNVGLFAGVEFNDYQILMQKAATSFHGHMATGTSQAVLANRISYFLNLTGPSEVISTACSSSLVAIHHAVNSIRRGETSVAIASGVSLMLNPETLIITSQLGALSADGRCKTFDKSANGYVKGEGIAAIVLKNLAQAQRDGDHIYGIIKGTAVNHGGKAQSLTAPNAATQSQLIVNAFNQANIDPTTVSYIETHGTGTELGDPIEIEGLKSAFTVLLKQQKQPLITRPFCGLGSVKTNIGHLEPASGITGLIKVLMSMQKGQLPGILHFKELNPYINLADSPFYIVEKTQPWERLLDQTGINLPRRAGISSFGFGGTCAHIVIEEFPATSLLPATNKPGYLITLSAKTSDSLLQKKIDLLGWLTRQDSQVSLEALSFTLNAGRTHFEKRCALVVNSIAELTLSLEAIIDNRIPNNYVVGDSKAVTHLTPLYSEIYSSVMETLGQYQKISAEIYCTKLLILADLYIQNYPIDWQLLHRNENKLRMTGLPTYPFVGVRFWYDEDEPRIQPSLTIDQNLKVDENVSLQTFSLNYLKTIFSEKLGISPELIAAEVTYEVYGVDSLIGLEITNRLENDFPKLPKTILYEKNSLNELSLYLEKKYKAKLYDLYQSATNGTIPALLNCSALPTINQTNAIKISADVEEPIAIIGLSGIFPQSNDMDEFWQNLITSRNCITEVPKERWDYNDYSVLVGGIKKCFKYGGFIPDIDKFDPLFFGIAPREAMLMDPQERLILQNTWTTLEDAGYTREKLAVTVDNQVGVFIGVTYNFYPLYIAEEWAKGNRLPLDVQLFSVANRVSYFLNLKGPSFIVDTACSSSLSAIHLAYESILRGDCVMAIAGGVNLSLHPAKYHFLGGYNFLSDKGECASFAEGGSGYVPSEGVGTVILKRLSQAIKDNDRIYGVIRASSMNHGGKTSGYTVPNPNAQAELIKKAIVSAQINPRSISYIEAHGTGTALGDPIEVRGLQEAFEEFTDEKQFCAIGSVKSNIGHLEAAAGISQLAKVLMQLKYQTLVPSIHAEKLNPLIDFTNTPFFVQRELNSWPQIPEQPRRAGVSSFGAGGTNVHLIVEEYQKEHSEQSVDSPPFILLLSALNKERLQEYVKKYILFFEKNSQKYSSSTEALKWLNQVCYTSQTGRENFSSRLALIGSSPENFLEKLKNYITATDKDQPDCWVNYACKVNSSPSDAINHSITTKQLSAIAQRWVKGGLVPWDKLYNKKINRIDIPTYPFAQRRCWVESTPGQDSVVEPKKAQTLSPENVNLDEWLYTMRWEKQSPRNQKKYSVAGQWLIFSDTDLGFTLQQELGRDQCIYCFAGENYEKLSDTVFYINPENHAEYLQLFCELQTNKNINLRGMIYLWSFEEANQSIAISYKLLHVFQALLTQNWQEKLLFCLVTRDSQAINNQKQITIWQHFLGSMVRIFAAEQANFQTLLLDLSSKKNLAKEANHLAGELQNYIPEENSIGYRNDERYIIKLLPAMSQSAPLESSNNWQAPEAAIITGGLGALGSEVAKWLLTQGTQYFLLLGTSELPDKSKWDKIEDKQLRDKFDTIRHLESQGATVHYSTVDITDVEELRNVIQTTESSWGKAIKGVLHLAGITTDNITVDKMDTGTLQTVFSAKVLGAFALHQIFNKPDLNCFVLFSSIAALPFFGMSGLSAYAMANEFLDGLAIQRRANGLQAISINWAAWAGKGMSHRYNHSAFLEAVGMSTISIELGIKLLQYAMARPNDNLIIFKIDWKKFLQINAVAKKLAFFSHFLAAESITARGSNTLNYYSAEQISTIVITCLAKLLQLDTAEIDPNAAYNDYGLDSIIGINFVAALGEHFPDVISPMDLYKYPSVKQLVNHINQSQEPAPSVTTLSDVAFQVDDALLVKEIQDLTDDEIKQLLENELNELDQLM